MKETHRAPANVAVRGGVAIIVPEGTETDDNECYVTQYPDSESVIHKIASQSSDLGQTYSGDSTSDTLRGQARDDVCEDNSSECPRQFDDLGQDESHDVTNDMSHGQTRSCIDNTRDRSLDEHPA